jgi:iron complex transport system ATP-binding protein
VLTTRALMSSPRLLLVDEPATGLDIAGRDELWDALTTVAREQPALSTVLVTHHL